MFLPKLPAFDEESFIPFFCGITGSFHSCPHALQHSAPLLSPSLFQSWHGLYYHHVFVCHDEWIFCLPLHELCSTVSTFKDNTKYIIKVIYCHNQLGSVNGEFILSCHRNWHSLSSHSGQTLCLHNISQNTHILCLFFI